MDVSLAHAGETSQTEKCAAAVSPRLKSPSRLPAGVVALEVLATAVPALVDAPEPAPVAAHVLPAAAWPVAVAVAPAGCEQNGLDGLEATVAAVVAAPVPVPQAPELLAAPVPGAAPVVLADCEAVALEGLVVTVLAIVVAPVPLPRAHAADCEAVALEALVATVPAFVVRPVPLPRATALAAMPVPAAAAVSLTACEAAPFQLQNSELVLLFVSAGTECVPAARASGAPPLPARSSYASENCGPQVGQRAQEICSGFVEVER